MVEYCRNTILNVENLMTTVTAEELHRVAEVLRAAETVYVVGYRASASLAHYFGYLLKKIRPRVVVDTNLSWELMDALSRGSRFGLLFAIAFPRYPQRTIEIVRYAQRYGIEVLGLSDTPSSPIITLADRYLLIDIEGCSFVDPFAHIIAFLGALIHEITFIDPTGTMEQLEKFDNGVETAQEFFVEEPQGGAPEDKFYGSYQAAIRQLREKKLTTS